MTFWVGSVARPWIDYFDAQVLEVPNVARGERRAMRGNDTGDFNIASFDCSTYKLPLGCHRP